MGPLGLTIRIGPLRLTHPTGYGLPQADLLDSGDALPPTRARRRFAGLLPAQARPPGVPGIRCLPSSSPPINTGS
jgi:hypothetical protein